MLAWLVRHARKRACTELVGEIIETPRNGSVRGLYIQHGFAEAEGGRFVFCLETGDIASPAWIGLSDSS